MGAGASSPRVTLIFDGTCGFCTRQVRYLHKLDKHHRLTSEVCQFVQHDPKYDLREADCGAMAWAIAEDGRRVGGAQVFTLIASVLLDAPWPVTVGRLPVIKQALSVGYGLIARNRYRFPGDTPPIEGASCRVDGGASST